MYPHFTGEKIEPGAGAGGRESKSHTAGNTASQWWRRVLNPGPKDFQVFESQSVPHRKNGRAAGLVIEDYREAKLVTRRCRKVGLVAGV